MRHTYPRSMFLLTYSQPAIFVGYNPQYETRQLFAFVTSSFFALMNPKIIITLHFPSPLGPIFNKPHPSNAS